VGWTRGRQRIERVGPHCRLLQGLRDVHEGRTPETGEGAPERLLIRGLGPNQLLVGRIELDTVTIQPLPVDQLLGRNDGEEGLDSPLDGQVGDPAGRLDHDVETCSHRGSIPVRGETHPRPEDDRELLQLDDPRSRLKLRQIVQVEIGSDPKRLPALARIRSPKALDGIVARVEGDDDHAGFQLHELLEDLPVLDPPQPPTAAL
jgi:hypothetical protein